MATGRDWWLCEKKFVLTGRIKIGAPHHSSYVVFVNDLSCFKAEHLFSSYGHLHSKGFFRPSWDIVMSHEHRILLPDTIPLLYVIVFVLIENHKIFCQTIIHLYHKRLYLTIYDLHKILSIKTKFENIDSFYSTVHFELKTFSAICVTFGCSTNHHIFCMHFVDLSCALVASETGNSKPQL